MQSPAVTSRRALDRRIISLAIPALGTLAIEPMYVLVDTAIVGRLGTPQLGGLAIAIDDPADGHLDDGLAGVRRHPRRCVRPRRRSFGRGSRRGHRVRCGWR